MCRCIPIAEEETALIMGGLDDAKTSLPSTEVNTVGRYFLQIGKTNLQ